MNIKVKLDPWGRMPTKAHEDDFGFDLYADAPRVIQPGQRTMIGTGVHIELPWNAFVQSVAYIKNRSSMFKKGILTDGTIDAGYRGEIMVCLWNTTEEPYRIEIGDRIAQLCIHCNAPIGKLVEVDALKESKRGSGGFGSSGK